MPKNNPMTDSPRYCATHQSYGDHHTDRCPLTFDDSPEARDRRMIAEARRLAALHRPTGDAGPAGPARPARRSLRARLRALLRRA